LAKGRFGLGADQSRSHQILHRPTFANLPTSIATQITVGNHPSEASVIGDNEVADSVLSHSSPGGARGLRHFNRYDIGVHNLAKSHVESSSHSKANNNPSLGWTLLVAYERSSS
jgi:hypothetical protein